MTYLELYHKASILLIKDEISLEEYRETIKPLNREIQEWIPTNPDEYPATYPKAFQEVWVTDGYGTVRVIEYGGERNIKAWMPYIKPEPYDASKENK